MKDEDTGIHETAAYGGAGERLRSAREAAGLSLEQVSAETRIPERHLAVIDSGNFDALPARTYAVGFSRSYAKVVGLDPREITDEVRAELGHSRPAQQQRAATFEPGDPARVPSRGLAFFSVFAILLLLVGGFMFYRAYFAPGSGPAPLVADEPQLAGTASGAAAGAGAAALPTPEPTGPVVFTARGEAWVRFYDGNGDVLMEGVMSDGDTYTVPADASEPQLRTGRPDLLDIKVGGRALPRLAEEDQVMSDVPVTAAALIARNDGAAQAAVPAGTVGGIPQVPAAPATRAPAAGTAN
ncbi:helix-turn-helix domain-containing protein [Pseudopontixanthobacter vadosimaris]|uniref:helix-turn-helix domain-containing protein n=1 Tax=Pseudopontixanthobacter vadosimaris TaxID=2726450 RepID=UPI001473BE2E|nr:helix-turn-helix domain-containing protein [Pseudopontixanthobacter vadosimaris]